MSGHLAAYNGIPSISIFGSQDPELTCPTGSKSKIIKPKISCSHKKFHWRLCEKCMLSIKPIFVYKEAIKFISEIKNKA
jgi:ADP-heptose:LPS heptosyltransferase